MRPIPIDEQVADLQLRLGTALRKCQEWEITADSYAKNVEILQAKLYQYHSDMVTAQSARAETALCNLTLLRKLDKLEEELATLKAELEHERHEKETVADAAKAHGTWAHNRVADLVVERDNLTALNSRLQPYVQHREKLLAIAKQLQLQGPGLSRDHWELGRNLTTWGMEIENALGGC